MVLFLGARCFAVCVGGSPSAVFEIRRGNMHERRGEKKQKKSGSSNNNNKKDSRKKNNNSIRNEMYKQHAVGERRRVESPQKNNKQQQQKQNTHIQTTTEKIEKQKKNRNKWPETYAPSSLKRSEGIQMTTTQRQEEARRFHTGRTYPFLPLSPS
eukprot:gene12371-8497_t